jgi:hydroxypyruvate isomerase
MERRNFLKNAAIGGLFLTGVSSALTGFASEVKQPEVSKFKLKYAPGLGAFKNHVGDDPIENIKFIADQGFRAVFDNGLMGRDPAVQEKIAGELARLGLDLGPFVLYADFGVKSFVTKDLTIKEMLKNKMLEGLEVRKRTGVKTALVVPGKYDEKLEWDYQTANVVENLRMCCDIVGNSGLQLVLEPLNAHTDHPWLFLTKMAQAKMICIAVDHPGCKIVDDMYHQQITEGNLIPNIDYCWDYIGAFHIGDNPGRKEPTSGEINYKNIFRHIYKKGFDGVLCCEHGTSLPGKEGEQVFIKAYREVDSFEV